MVRTYLLAATAFLVLTSEAFAQSQCMAPVAPSVPDGAKATAAQMTATQNQIMQFAKASDDYQACLNYEIERQKQLAKQSSADFDPKVQASFESQSADQRTAAARLASEWRATVQAFNKVQQSRGSSPAAMPSGGAGRY